MKLILTSTILLLSTAAYATPAVGDSATYILTVKQDGATSVGSGKLEILAKTDSGYELKQTTTIDGETSEQKADVSADDFLDDATIADILKECTTKYNGKNEELTVSAGKISVCTGVNGNGTISIGAVPMGIVKRVDVPQDGVTVTLELKEYVAGK